MNLQNLFKAEYLAFARRLVPCVLVLWISCTVSIPLAAQDQEVDPSLLEEEEIPVIDRDPFDRIHFDKLNGERKLDIVPIITDEIDANTPIDPQSMDGRLVFEMRDYPGRVFAVQWGHLVKVERYSELVLAEANEAMNKGDYGTAFKSLSFLMEKNMSTTQLEQMMDLCLYNDAEANLAAGNFSDALTAYEELYDRNPRYGGGSLLNKISTCYDQFVREQVEADEFQKARDILQEVSSTYGQRMETINQFWQEEMRKRALDELERVQTGLDAEEGFDAHRSVRRLMYVNPDLPESAAVFNEVVTKFPYVYVGVAQPSMDRDVRRVDNWASRRIGRLTKRSLMEYGGPGDEGGKYDFPSGRFSRIDDVGLEYRFEILDLDGKFGVPPLTSYEVSNRLLDLADPDTEDYYVPWARIVESVAIDDERSVTFRLRYPHVRPEALLPIPYFSRQDVRSDGDDGVYAQTNKTEVETVFEVNPEYPRPETGQFPLIVERLYKNTSEATEALIRGELDVIDRVFPADIRRLERNPAIEVKPYIVPTVHLLIPNPRNDFMRSDHFRRALLYGINRPLILEQMIAGGRLMDGYQLISGPFPPGTESADQFAYAYDHKIRPREFSGRLSIVLAEQYRVQEELRREKEAEKEKELAEQEGRQYEMPEIRVDKPTLILAHPDNELIATICTAIAQQWGTVGIKTELRRLPPGITQPDDDEYDLLFVELQMREPMVDAYRLFGRGGLVKMVDPTIKQALRQLDSAYSWGDVSSALRRVHRQCANNLSVIPLWQIVEHIAYRKNLFRVGDQLVHPYQNVTEWQITGELPQVSKNE